TEEMRSRLETLLGAKAEAALDGRSQSGVRRELETDGKRREDIAAAGSALAGAVVQFLGTLAPPAPKREPAPEVVDKVRQSLGTLVDVDAAGQHRLTIPLPDSSTIDQLAQALARILAQSIPA